MLISIIITTKNEAANIENCLKSVKGQSYPKDKLEIIVVDNNSADKTRELAGKYTDNVYNLPDYLDLTNVKNFRGAQLNFGVEKSNGEVIFFPDADMTFDRNLFSDVVQKLKTSDALYVPEIVCGNGFFGKVRNFERSFYNETCIDGVRFVKKEAFLKAGGFDVENIVFGPDDWDFTKTLKKNNAKLGITKKPLFHHEENLSWKDYLSKKGKYANTFEGYIKKWGRDDTDVQRQFGIFYRFGGVFLERGKWKKICVHPILFLGMMGLKFAVGALYLAKK